MKGLFDEKLSGEPRTFLVSQCWLFFKKFAKIFSVYKN